MKSLLSRSLCAALLLPVGFAAHPQAPGPQIIGYIAAHDRLIQLTEIDPHKITRIQYAFLYPIDGQVSGARPTDAANLRTLVALKQLSPALKVVPSIGGGAHSSAFSDIALTAASRARFTASCITLIQSFHLDGIDIDWEYPMSPRPDGSVRSEDRHNYTLLLQDLRIALTRSEHRLHKHLILSTATNGKPFFVRSVELAEVAKCVDYIELMGYDFYGYNNTTTGNQSALFTDPADPSRASDDRFVTGYIAAGVPAEKIVLGVPFYAHGWTKVPPTQHGLFQPITTKSFDILYAEVASKYLSPNSGFQQYWDEASAVPFLYNDASQAFVTYENPRSIKLKAAYVLQHHLAGIMFWDYNGDPAGQLLDAIDISLNLTP